MPQPARQPDTAPQPEPQAIPQAIPQLVPPSPRGARAAARRGGRGEQPPLLVPVDLLNGSSPPSPARVDRREEMQALLAEVGVRKAWVLARDYPAEHIEGWVAAWQEDRAGGADIGPGALAVRIEQWGPPPEAKVKTASGAETEAEWLERRYARGAKGRLR